MKLKIQNRKHKISTLYCKSTIFLCVVIRKIRSEAISVPRSTQILCSIRKRLWHNKKGSCSNWSWWLWKWITKLKIIYAKITYKRIRTFEIILPIKFKFVHSRLNLWVILLIARFACINFVLWFPIHVRNERVFINIKTYAIKGERRFMIHWVWIKPAYLKDKRRNIKAYWYTYPTVFSPWFPHLAAAHLCSDAGNEAVVW